MFYSNLIFTDKLVLGRISDMVYKIIHTLLCDATGESNEYAVTFLFKCILVRLLSSCSDSRNSNVSTFFFSGLVHDNYKSPYTSKTKNTRKSKKLSLLKAIITISVVYKIIKYVLTKN